MPGVASRRFDLRACWLASLFLLAASYGGGAGPRADARAGERIDVTLRVRAEDLERVKTVDLILTPQDAEAAAAINLAVQVSKRATVKLARSVKYVVTVVRARGSGIPVERLQTDPSTLTLTEDGVVELSLTTRPGPCTLHVVVSPLVEGSARADVKERREGRYVEIASLRLEGGRGSLPGLWPGTYRVSLAEAPPGTAGFRVLAGGFGYALVRTNVVVEAGATQARAVLRAQAAGAVGVVIDRNAPSELPLSRGLSFHRRFEDYWCPLPHAPTPVSESEEVTADGKRVATIEYANVPTGTYRLILREKGFVIQMRQFEVESGGRVACRFSDFRPGVELTVEWAGDVPTTEDYGSTVPLNVNRYDSDGVSDVGRAVLRADARSALMTGLRPGRYLAIVWSRELARVVDLTEAPRHLVLDPPERFIAGGSRRVHVTVDRGGRNLVRLMVGLVPRSEKGVLRDGDWIRYRSLGRSATFVDVPPGAYDLLVFDRVFGARYGFSPNPVRRPIRVGQEDVSLSVSID